VFTRRWGIALSDILCPLGLEPKRNLDPESNGEYALLRRLRHLTEIEQFDSVIDVGAHRGEWTAEAIVAFAGTNVRSFYCVEPMPELASALRERFSENPDVRVVEAALAAESANAVQIYDAAGTGRIYPSYEGRSFEALQARAGQRGAKKRITPLTVRAISGDQAFAGMKPCIVKIDCEGHDLHVLRGFTSLLRTARPLIQFEYSEFWIAAGSRLRDACHLLSKLDYHTYRMFPDRLARFRYVPGFETYGYQNIVAVPAGWQSSSAQSLTFKNPDA
jgi:FkbM family methyltransferase